MGWLKRDAVARGYSWLDRVEYDPDEGDGLKEWFAEEKKRVCEESRRWARRENAVIIDTETTDVYGKKQRGPVRIISIAAINMEGETLFNSLVNPRMKIPASSTAINHITDKMVADAPRFSEIYDDLARVIDGRPWIVYNLEFDLRVIREESHRAGRVHIEPSKARNAGWEFRDDAWCAMEAYAAFHGSWNDYFGSFTWQKLSVAAKRFGLSNDGAHDALFDCQMTLGLVRALARL